MRNLTKQRGIGMMGFVFVAIVVGFVGLVALKLMPFYQEYAGVQRSLNQLKEQPDIKQMSDNEIKNKLLNQFYLNDVRDIKGGNFEQHIVIEPFENTYVLKLNYTREAPLFYNIHLNVKFQQDFTL